MIDCRRGAHRARSAASSSRSRSTGSHSRRSRSSHSSRARCSSSSTSPRSARSARSCRRDSSRPPPPPSRRATRRSRSSAPPLGGSLFGLGAHAAVRRRRRSRIVFSFVSLLAMRTPFQEEREPDTDARARAARRGLPLALGHRSSARARSSSRGRNLMFEALFLVLIVAAKRHGLSGGEIGALHRGLRRVLAARLDRRAAHRPAALDAHHRHRLASGCSWLRGVPASKPSVYVLLAGVVPMAFFLPTVQRRRDRLPHRGRRPTGSPGRVGSVARTIALCAAPLGPLSAGLLLALALAARDGAASIAALHAPARACSGR